MAQFVEIADKLIQLLVETYSLHEYILNALYINVHGGADDVLLDNERNFSMPTRLHPHPWSHEVIILSDGIM
jgi:hypothetical protein